MWMLQWIGFVLCALYTLAFLVLGTLLAQEMWNDRQRIPLNNISVARQISCVSIFFVAAVIFGALTWICFPI